MFGKKVKLILKEVTTALDAVDEKEIEELIRRLLKARRIVVAGAGRMGMAGRAFAMRLGHLGLTAYFWGEATVPSLSDEDILLVCSGSGETQIIYDIVTRAKEKGAQIVTITANRKSRIGEISNHIVRIKVPSKTNNIKSQQPMTSLAEQCVYLLFDSVVLLMMDKTEQTHDDMWRRHSILE